MSDTYTVYFYPTSRTNRVLDGPWRRYWTFKMYDEAIVTANELRHRGDHAHAESTAYLDVVGLPTEPPGRPGSLLYRDCNCPACLAEFREHHLRR